MAAISSQSGGLGENVLNCPNNHGPMERVKETETVVFRGVELNIENSIQQCPVCKLKAATATEAGKIQNALADAYRKHEGLMTGEEIRDCRKKMGLTQQDLATMINAGIASIKRWENGAVQTSAMDRLLRTALKWESNFENPLTGNRALSLARVKLVVRQFEKCLGRKLLVEGDKMLFTAKYVFYADMVAFRDLGKGMTGATYAALPNGPQLNNYRDLIDEINDADENQAEPLSQEEIIIIQHIATKFPQNWDVYNASHRENVVIVKPPGSIIFYTDANKIVEI